MLIIRLWIIACCLAAVLLGGCGADEPEQRSAPSDPLLTQRAPDKAWADGFDGTWDAFSPLLTERAEDKAWARDFDPAWSAWQACPGPAAKPKRLAARRPAAPKVPVTLDGARERFKTFAGDWMAKVGRNLKHSKERMAVDSGPQGFVARFTSVAEDTLVLKVKASTSPGCDFVGVMRYEEHHFENRGGSYSEAVEGPFSRTRRLRVTEIFRFVAGRWIN